MSALSDIPASLPKPADEARRGANDDEPFGQRGIRQYAGRVLSWICLVGLAVALSMWYRSTQMMDRLNWSGSDSVLEIRSVAGRLMVEANTFQPRPGRPQGWVYRGGKVRRVIDGWEPSVLKMIGVEFHPGPSRTDGLGGFWLRVKWYFIAGLCAIVPMWRGIARVVRRRRTAGEEAE